MAANTVPEAPAPGVPGGPADLVAEVRDRLVELTGELWAAKSPEQLLAANAELERLRSAVAAVQAQVAVEIDATDAQKTEGWASAADYLTGTAGAYRGHGNRLLRTDRALCGPLATTLAALTAGDISPEHARVIAATVNKLPIDPELRQAAQKWLLERAATLIASELKDAAEKLLEVLDPDGTKKRDEAALARLERAAHLNRHLSITEDGQGGVKVRGRASIEDAATLKAALASLSAPEPHNDDPRCGLDGKDPRDHGTRTWDALVKLAQKAIDAEVLPESHGVKPRIVVTIDHETLRSGVGTGTLDTGERISTAAVRRLIYGSSTGTRRRGTGRGGGAGSVKARRGGGARGADTPSQAPGPPARTGSGRRPSLPATPTTSSAGSTAAPPAWTTSCCSAAATTP